MHLKSWNTACRAIPSISLQHHGHTACFPARNSASATLCKLWPMAEEGLRLSGGSKTEQLHHKTPVHTLRKRHLDAMLWPCNTCHCSTEILWFPTFNLYMPVAFPMHRKRRLERILCIWSLVSQTILPSGFVLHFKVDLGKSKSFAVCTIKKKKVGSKCKKGFHQCLWLSEGRVQWRWIQALLNGAEQ